MKVLIQDAVPHLTIVEAKGQEKKRVSVKNYIRRNAGKCGSGKWVTGKGMGVGHAVADELEQEVMLALWQRFGMDSKDGMVETTDPEVGIVCKKVIDTYLQREYRSQSVSAGAIDQKYSDWVKEQKKAQTDLGKKKKVVVRRPRKQKRSPGIYRELHEYDPYEEAYGSLDPVFEEIDAAIMVEQALATMPPKVAKAMLMKLDLKMTHDEIAKRMNCSAWTVMSWVRQGKILLALFLNREEELAKKEEEGC